MQVFCSSVGFLTQLGHSICKKYQMSCAGRNISNFSIEICSHWRTSHYNITHMHNKNRNIQGRSPNVVKVIKFSIPKDTAL